MNQAKTRLRMTPDQRRWYDTKTWHRVYAIGLTLLYIVMLGAGVYYWTSSTTDWGLTMAAAGPQPCGTLPSCQSWEITTAANSTLLSSGITAHDYLCDANGQPLTATTSVANMNSAQTLTFAHQHTCANPTTITIQADIVPLTTTIIYILIALSCAILAVLIALHATQRQIVPHVVATLTALTAAFAWLPIAANQQFLQTSEIAAASYLTPALLVTLLWRLLLPPPERHKPIFRAIMFVLLLASAGILSTLIMLAEILHNDELYLLDRTFGIFLLASYILAPILVLSAFIARRGRRDYARVLGIGVIVGLAPLLIFAILPVLLNRTTIINGSIAAITFIAIPMSLAFVILKRDLLRVDSLVRITVERALQILLLTFVAAVVLSFITLVAKMPAWAAIVIFFLLLVFGTLIPVMLQSARWLTETWLFPQVRRYRQVLAQSALPARIATPEQIAEEIIGEVRLALPIPRAALFVEQPESGIFCEIALDSVTASPQPITILNAHHALLHQLSNGDAIVQDDLPPTIWMHHHGDQSTSTLTQWALFVPIIMREHLIAFLAVAARDDQERYSPTDRTVLQLLAGRRALTLDYARIVVDLRNALEQQQALDHLKDQFIMTAHHELRTPLTAVVGYLELIRETPQQEWKDDPESIKYFLDSAVSSSDDLTHLLENMLTADRMALQNPKIEPEWINLDTLIHQIVTDVEQSNEAKTHAITVQSLPTARVWTDSKQVKLVLANLLTNALKYSPAHAPVVVFIQENKHDPSFFDVVVRDWGKGIPLDQQHHIFDEFVRLERDLNSPVRGTGLGLFIAKRLITAMGGDIWVESTGIPGEGSTFYFTLPRATQAGEQLTPTTKLTLTERMQRRLELATGGQ